MSKLNPELEEWLSWRQEKRHQRRIMTSAEYAVWCRGGDAISSCNESNPFPGGLTIIFGEESSIIGRCSNE